MKALIDKRVPVAWFLLLCIALGAIGIGWVAATRDLPPANALLIQEPQPTPRQPTSKAALLPTATPPPVSDASAQALTPQTLTSIVVYVSGAVHSPGVYTLPDGARVGDAVRSAGGMLPNADTEAVNLAAHASDEEHIDVPVVGATPVAGNNAAGGGGATHSTPPHATSPAASKAATPGAGQLLNINTATTDQLEALPGIGPSLAARIVADREKNGPFASVDDLTRVSGIKGGMLAKIRAFITVGN